MTNLLASLGKSVHGFFAANVNLTDLGSAFKLMGQGMLGIFIVMAAISLIVYLLTKISSKK